MHIVHILRACSCVTQEKRTPLMIAAQKENVEIINVLLNANADVYATDDVSCTAIYLPVTALFVHICIRDLPISLHSPRELLTIPPPPASRPSLPFHR